MARRSSGPPWLRWVIAAAMIAVFFLTRYYLPREERAERPDPPVAERPDEDEAPQRPLAPQPADHALTKSAPTKNAPTGKTFVEGTLAKNVILRDVDGNTVFRGDVELKSTLERIAAKKRLDRFYNDGIAFQNRERRLPQKPAGYYHEWVHPTPEIHGPGPQRIVTGNDGDLWYTPDHYARFYRIRTQ